MSLVCDETGRTLICGEQLFFATRGDVETFSAIAEEIINRIPQEERRTEPCQPGDGGVDIHLGTAEANWPDSGFGEPPADCAYAWNGMQLGDFVFSISRETAEAHIPKHIRKYS